MTVQELYEKIDGSYDQAVSIMRMDKLIDKHIRRFGDSGVFESLQDAGETMDAKALFEASHALKGISANLGLAKLSSAASEISEEFRPGNPRLHTDEEVKNMLDNIYELYQKTVDGIKDYVNGL
ncbi:MAG: Hpt domain-containing protein [Firmicutes bacterium]|nr:Hpt domain-containing protein [Bacillota bacterium]